MRLYAVYIMASMSGTLYVGATNDLVRRVDEHKKGKTQGFTKKYQCNKLVYYELSEDIESVLNREKQIKKWRREKKENLIRNINPGWKDLYGRLIR